MTAWNEYFARYRALPVWSPEFDEQQDQEYEDKLVSTEESLVADFSVYYPPSSQDDITWFKTALEHEERKFFVAFVLKESRTPSKNRAFVPPCVATFALRRVNESLLQWFENGSDLEKAGAMQALYHVGLVGVPDSCWRRPDSGAGFKLLGDLWMRQRCLLLREFVNNPSLLVRQRIIPHLDLIDPSSYPEELQPLVPQAIQIARNHADAYIRHRLEIEMGSDERQLFAPLPAMERSEAEDLLKSGTPGSYVSATRKLVPRLKSLVNRLRRWRP